MLINLFFGLGTADIQDDWAVKEQSSRHALVSHQPPMQKKKKEHPGKALFLSSSCINCHGTDQKGIGTNPPLLKLAKKYKAAEITGFIKNGKGGMPPNYELTDEEVELISLYLVDQAVPSKKKVVSLKK